jgi:ComEC/Rec2-related protein
MYLISYRTLLVIIFLLLILFIKKFKRSILIFIVAFSIGTIRYAIFESQSKKDVQELSLFYGEEVEVYGIVETMARNKNGYSTFLLNNANIHSNRISSSISTVRCGMLISWYNTLDSDNLLGYEVEIKGKILEPSGVYGNYLKTQGICAIVQTSEVNIGQVFHKSFFIFMTTLKHNINKKVEKLYPRPYSSLLSGIVYGEKDSLSEDLVLYFQRSGTSHIIAVSGFNVTLLVSSIFICSAFIKRKNLIIFSLFFIILFMFFVGVENVPVVRATLLGITYLISQSLGKKNGVFISYLFILDIMFCFNPLIFTQISFQLSFLSTLGLITVAPLMKKILKILPDFFRENTATTLAAILFTLPVILLGFGKISLFAPITNLFILPAISFVTIGGIIIIILAFVYYPLAEIISYILWIPLFYIIKVVSFIGNNKYASVDLSTHMSIVLSFTIILLIIFAVIEFLYKSGTKNYDFPH